MLSCIWFPLEGAAGKNCDHPFSHFWGVFASMNLPARALILDFEKKAIG
jgi:hypothetical protein